MLAENVQKVIVLTMNTRRDCSAGNSVDNECSQRMVSGQ